VYVLGKAHRLEEMGGKKRKTGKSENRQVGGAEGKRLNVEEEERGVSSRVGFPSQESEKYQESTAFLIYGSRKKGEEPRRKKGLRGETQKEDLTSRLPDADGAGAESAQTRKGQSLSRGP